MSRVRVADLIAEVLVRQGVHDVFMLTGGGAMHLNDALGRHSELRKVFNHHEQASAIAAESYARASGRVAALNVTTGPGGINALNGVFGAYVDSLPMIVISGQVKRETFAGNYHLALRQLGDQEVDIVSMVRGITKYATVLQDPDRVLEVMEKAIWLSRRGRPGPVWIDVPIDVQGAFVEADSLASWFPPSEDDDSDIAPNTRQELGLKRGTELQSGVAEMLELWRSAERPVVLAGNGVRLSGGHQAFLQLIERLGGPVVTGWNAHDLLPNAHPLYAGRPGSVGDRAGNFAVQNADFVLVLGCRLNIRQISYNWESFARNAKVVMVDVDRAELEKPTLRLHMAIHADLGDFIEEASAQLDKLVPKIDHEDYVAWCRARVERYPVVLSEYWNTTSAVNPYCFAEALFDSLEEGDVVVTGDGTACVTVFQAANIKSRQRLYTNSGCASMGYDLPAAIGAYVALGGRRIICIAGDGSLMMNLQELQTISGGRIPIKIFVLNNDGYHSIRQTQVNYFPDNIVGCGPDSGLSFPNFEKLGHAFDIPSARISVHGELSEGIARALSGDGPYLCEVMLDKEQAFAPKLSSRKLEDGSMVSSNLEDMAPFLSREELAENLIANQGGNHV
jgi:acetolactate synthase-1/2/3 large subunit